MSAPSSRSWRRVLGALVPFVGLLVGLGLLVSMVDLKAVWQALLAADLRWVAVALCLSLNATLIVGWKLWAVVRIVDEPRTFREAWSAVMAGVSLNAVLPGRGGDLVRAVFLAREPGTLPVLLGVVLVERLGDLFALGLLVLVIAPRGDLITLAALLVVVGSIAVTVTLGWLGPNLPVRPDLGERVSRTAGQILQRPGYALMAVSLSMVAWINNTLLLLCTLRAVGVTAPGLELTRAAAVGILAGVMPVSISGIGTRDAVLVLVLEPYGQAASVAAGSFLFTVLMYWFLALVGSVSLGTETLRAVRRAAAERRPSAD